MQADLCIDLKTRFKHVGRHNMTFTADHPEHHDHCRELGLQYLPHRTGVDGYPPVVLLVDLLILTEIIFIREKPQHPGP
uniref:Uncharacterized protein n=1 Tax=Lepeophtheirus salmonis TaxID=72036 RepID=A0A0K2URN1_LEPSM